MSHQRKHMRRFIAVDGMGRPTRVGLLKPRCESRRPPDGPDAGLGPRCGYTAGHDGYHCDQNGLTTWETP